MNKILLAFSRKISKEEINRFQKGKEHIICSIGKEEEIALHISEKPLVITDREDIYKEALKQNMAFLIYFSDWNNSSSFPEASYAITTLDGIEVSYLERVYNRFHHIPWHILNTKRCRVREMTLKDLDALYEIYEDPSITRYMEGLYEERDKEAEYTKDYIKNVYGFYGYGLWIIEEKKSGKIIGRAGISHREEYEDPELGYVIGKAYQNQGYATEVCKAILQYGMEEIGLQHFNAFVHKENLSSIRICQKCGFKKIGQASIGDEMLEWYYL